MEERQIKIEKLERHHWRQLANDLVEEGWNYRESELETEHQTDIFVALHELRKGPVGCVAATRVEKAGYISLLFVRREFRSAGIGKQLWAAAEAQLMNQEAIFLATAKDSPLMSSLVVESHFSVAPQELVQLEGKANVEAFSAPNRLGNKVHVCHAQMVRAEDIAELDFKIVGYNRVEWIRSFLQHSNAGKGGETARIPKSVSLVVTEDPGHITGWGTIRPGAELPVLGPVYARTEKSARALLRALLDSHYGARRRGVRCSVPASNAPALELLGELGLSRTKRSTSVLCSTPEFPFSVDTHSVLAAADTPSQLF